MSVYGTDPSLVSVRTARTSTGTSTIKVYDGSSSGVNTVIAGLSTWDQWDIDDSNAPMYRLTVRSPVGVDSAESLEWTWEVAATEIQRDMKEHPVILYAVESIPNKDGETALREVIKAVQDASELAPNASIPAEQYLGFQRLYQVMLRGQTHFLWPHYTLRFTATVGPAFAGGITDDGALRLYMANQIVSEFAAFPMYARTQARIQALQAMDPSKLYAEAGIQFMPGYTWGWLKKPMSETQLRDFKIQLSTEWELELWETSLPTYLTL